MYWYHESISNDPWSSIYTINSFLKIDDMIIMLIMMVVVLLIDTFVGDVVRVLRTVIAKLVEVIYLEYIFH